MKIRIFLLLGMLAFGFLLWKYINQPQIIWKIDAKNIISNLYLANNIIYAPTLDNYYEAINTQNGNILWKDPVDSLVLAQPLLKQDTISFMTKNGTIYQVNRLTGEKAQTDNHLNSQDFSLTTFQGNGFNGSAEIGQTIYHTQTKCFSICDASYSILYATDKTTGLNKWAWPEHLKYLSHDQDSVYVMSGDFLYRVR
jgi:outer membrane protein assembly factor BamB